MCGILALLLNQPLPEKGNPSAPTFSWRQLWNQLNTIKGRGPDSTQLKAVSRTCVFGFQRLRINDLSDSADQPLRRGPLSLVCNGEIYNFMDIKEKYGFEFSSGSDCEIILHLFEKYGNLNDFIDELDGVFAFALHDESSGITYLARDAIGVRPIFYGKDPHNQWAFASEAKVLNGLCDPKTIKAFAPGSIWDSKSESFTQWWNPEHNLESVDLEQFDEAAALKTTAELLYKSVQKRMLSDRPIGTFLSGGLDSSLVAAFIMKHLVDSGKSTRLNTFSVGLEGSPDLAYAKVVAEYIKSNHHHVEIEMQDCLDAVEDVVYAGETFDVTTIRASTPMYILSRYIRDKTGDVVIYSGEGSDEVTQGYLYFKNQPTPAEGAIESKRLMDQLFEFDVLRVDRMTASHGLEVREPFLDKDFMRHYFSLPANVKCPRNGKEKFHLRQAIAVTFPGLLPDEILWRQKEAFSDGISSFKKKSWVDEIKDQADATISDDQFVIEAAQYNPPPKFKDALFLRRIYNKFYGQIEPGLISKYWIPKWSGENPDSSARVVGLVDEKNEDRKMEIMQQETIEAKSGLA